MTSLAQISLSWRGCTDCSLASTRHKVVFHRGDPRARIVIVGRAPSQQDELAGEPMSGVIKRKLSEVLRDGGIDPNRVFVIDMVGCRPFGDGKPARDSVSACEPRTAALINRVKPEIVIMLGPVAAMLAGLTTVDPWRGQPIDDIRVGKEAYRGIVTYHPRALIDRPELQRKAVSDMRVARSMLSRVEEEGDQ